MDFLTLQMSVIAVEIKQNYRVPVNELTHIIIVLYVALVEASS